MDGLRRRRRVGRDSLVAVLRALGVGLDGAGEAEGALRDERDRRARRRLEPVAVAWNGEGTATVRVASKAGDRPLGCTLVLEDGEELRWRASPAGVEPDPLLPEDAGSLLARAPLPGDLPRGYHRLHVEGAGEALVIAAPQRAHAEPGWRWSLFAPIYALRTERDTDVGNLTDLGSLADWVGELGGDLVGTLPPLAAFLDRPFEPSPYAPVSRLFWNELYVDPARAPELKLSPEARDLLEASERGTEAIQHADIVDHRKAMSRRRPVLEVLARAAEDAPPPSAFQEAGADLDGYARFRAACERHGAGWPGWPSKEIHDRDLDPQAVRYHRYVQELAERQLAELGARAGLYLDLPLGVHADGFDTWSRPETFAPGISIGAPPDAFSDQGQDWGFPPMHPERILEDGLRYPIGAVRTLLRHSRALRVDHAAGLHRLYWVPQRMPATHGAYVRYPREALYAILCLESHRRGAVIVGEDLGTVPPEVPAALRRHGFLPMFITQTEIRPHRRPPVRRVPAGSLAGLNTHDMPTFASFWEGRDVDLRVRLGILSEERAQELRALRDRMRTILVANLEAGGWLEDGRREPDTAEVLEAALRHLASSDAALVSVALEDVWLETEQQNLPGTTTEHLNWSHRLRHTLEEVRRLGPVLGRLEELDRLRRREES